MKTRSKAWRLLRNSRRWLSLGIGIKRWILLLGVGAALTGIGLVHLVLVLNREGLLPGSAYRGITLQFLPVWLRILLPLSLGGMIILLAVTRIGANLVKPFRRPGDGVIESLYDFSRQGRGPHIVAIGGGTGLPTLLRGVAQYTRNITAIVTVADDGGSSGRLRKELGLLPPGDFRNNLAALSRDESLLVQLLQYRFGGTEDGQGELQGHSFGNLLLAALTGITGSFDEALLAAERVLALRGRVLPSTLENVTLVADVEVEKEGEDAKVLKVVGESAIPSSGGRVRRIALEPANARAYPAALRALFEADLILIGPGSLYTSILPNLLVDDLAEALHHATAPKVYICNLATQPGETDNYSVADHVASIVRHVPSFRFDAVLANDNFSVSPTKGGGKTIFVDLVAPEQAQLIRADLVDEERPWRHDEAKLAAAVMDLLSWRAR
jgi:uncharacterized cofD-like protein